LWVVGIYGGVVNPTLPDRRFCRCEIDVPMLLALRGRSRRLNIAAKSIESSSLIARMMN
jgi:hypothetical protein